MAAELTIEQLAAQSGMTVSQSREIEESIGLLRPLATEALVAIFGQRMRAQIDSAFADRPSR